MSTSGNDERPLPERLEDLEVRMAYLEHMLGELDTVVRQTADELAHMGAVVKDLRKQAEVENGEIQRLGLQEEKPPHY